MVSRIHGDSDAYGARIDFAVNVANVQPNWLIDALSSALSNIAAYPSAAEMMAVTELVAQFHQVPTDHVLLLAGASEGFAMLPKLGIKAPVVVHPGFSEPDIVLSDASIPVRRLVLAEPFHQDFLVPDGTDLLVIGNPTNPTGVLWSKKMLVDKLAPGRFLVVDEAFLDLVGEEYSLAGAVVDYPGLIVLRSLTKTWGIAGLRVGYVIAQPQVLAMLAAGRAHWPLGTLQLAAIRAVFEHGVDELVAMRGAMADARELMLKALASIGLVPVSDSCGPFVLVKVRNWPGAKVEEIRQELLRRGIAIRRCDTFPGLGWKYWRLAVRDEGQVRALIAEFNDITQGEN